MRERMTTCTVISGDDVKYFDFYLKFLQTCPKGSPESDMTFHGWKAAMTWEEFVKSIKPMPTHSSQNNNTSRPKLT